MSEIGWGLLLNLLFWVAVASATVFVIVLGSLKLFLGATQRVRKTAHALRGAKEPPEPPQARGEAGERYRKAS